MARISRHYHDLEQALRSAPDLDHFVDPDEMIGLSRRHQTHGEKFSAGTPSSSSASAPHSDDTAETPRNPVRQNARPILAFDVFTGMLNAIKYQ
jgi:hypothetical protein